MIILMIFLHFISKEIHCYISNTNNTCYLYRSISLSSYKNIKLKIKLLLIINIYIFLQFIF